MRDKITAWLALSRIPFHLVGVLPFILGNVYAWKFFGSFRWDIFLWAVVGVVLIMLATYYAGEYWDYETDALSAQEGTSKFAGGSQVLQRGLLPRRAAFYASILCVALALIIGFILQFIYLTGFWTLPLGILAIFTGFFYSTKPFRWVSRGIGEILIGFSYGWLPIAVGFYLQVGYLILAIHVMAIPIGLTIFNVILLNEIPDYTADKETGKKNLVVRLGPDRAATLYAIVAITSWVAMLFVLSLGFPIFSFLFYLPVLVVSIALVVFILRGAWKNRDTLEKLCGLNILVNLGTTLVFILVIWVF
jgi:1,4-dihydroxy-2-naphthoate octaprenyltransferase